MPPTMPISFMPGRRRTRLWLLRIHQDKGHAAGLAAAVHPRVVGRLLHDHVPCLEMHLVSSSSISISPDMMIA